jgi:hypothetical protein
MMVSFHAIRSEESMVVDDQSKEDDEKKNNNKKRKRKLMKDLKLYTVQKGEEPAFRGWSPRAYSDMATYRVAIKKDACLYERFDRAYRKVYDRMNKNPNCAKAGEQLVTDVEYDQLYDFPGIAV